MQDVPPDFSGEDWFASNGGKSFHFLNEQEALQKYCRDGRLDVVLVTVTDEEYRAAIQRFFVIPHDFQPQGSKSLTIELANVGSLTVYFGKLNPEQTDSLNFGLIHQPAIGAFTQFSVVSEVIKKLKPRAIVSVGIGWGNNTHSTIKLRVGDVMVSSSIQEFTANTRLGPDNRMHSRSEMPAAGTLLITRFKTFSHPGHWTF